ncbi:MAG: SDR family NAD(P)-dependent oxidoreductase [Acidobacteriota bacterium]
MIKGSAINNDGSLKVGYTAPGVEGQAEVIRRAQARAGVEPRSIGYVEAHGTGTSLGDPVEIAALTQAFRAGTPDAQFCAIGSLKSNVGHLDAAAGVAGLIKAALSLWHGALAPTLHFDRPNAAIDFERSPFVVNTRLRDWPAGASPRRAAVSSFGLGGTNAHAVLEEAPVRESVASVSRRSSQGSAEATSDQASSQTARNERLLVLSAKSPSALQAAALNLASHLETHPALNLADVAFTLQVGRRTFGHRLALVCADRERAAAALRNAPAGDAVALSGTPAVTFMFTGQGSQQVNMMRRLYETEPVFRQHFDECARRGMESGIDLHAAVYPAVGQTAEAASLLGTTAMAQPALFAVEYSLAQLWRSWGIVPAAMIGHSLGEYVAACVSGVLALDEALALVVLRGRLMQALEPGAMLAVPLGEAELAPHLEGTTVAIAAVNAPSSSVVSGTFDAVDRLERTLAQHGLECQRLQTSHAFHSAMMDPALDAFRAAVTQVHFGEPRIPYVSNLTGDWITPAEAASPDYWVRHLRGTVRFHDGLTTVLQRPGCVLLEIGPGQTLTSLARAAAHRAGVGALASLTKAPAGDDPSLMPALGRLWALGAPIDWPAMHGSRPRVRVPQLPTYPFERQRYWIDAPAATPGRSPRRLPVEQWLYSPGWATGRARRLASDESVRAGAWLVLADASGVGDAVVEALRARTATVVRVRAGATFVASPGAEYVVCPDHPADYDTVLAEIRGAAFEITRVINCWPIDASRGTDSSPFYSSLFLVQSLVRHYPDTAMQFMVVTSEAHEVIGGERIDPGASMAIWPARVLPLEYPHLNAIAVDLGAGVEGSRSAEAESLIEEAIAAPGDRVVALRNHRRWVQVFQPMTVDAQRPDVAPIRAGGVYLVTGGTGGVGLELARYLAASAPVRLALMSRSAIPARGLRSHWIAQHGEDDTVSRVIRQIERIESDGAEVLAVQADAADEAQVRAALAAILERFGGLNGVFLATGADKTPRALEEATREQCDEQFRSRVQAVDVIDRVLGDRALDFCVVHSSLSAVLGAAGFAAYTAAHLFVDAFAVRRNRRAGTPWTVIDWDNWTTWKTVSAPAGQDTGYRMTTGEAFEALNLVLAQRAAPHVVVSTMDLPSRMTAATARVSMGAASSSLGTEHRRPTLDTAYVAPSTPVERILAGVWQELLGIDRVGVHDNFFALGGDSVVGIQVVARASAAGVRLTTRQAFAHQTIAELAEVAVPIAVRALQPQVAGGPVSLTPIQHWLFEQTLPDPDHFNQAVWLELDRLPTADTLERAAAAVAAHHDALRLRFVRVAGGWEQRTGAAPHTAVSLFDLAGLPEVAQEASIQREAAALQRSLNLAAGPLLRLALFNRGAVRPALLFVVAHHLIVDALSWRILLEDLGLAVEQGRSGRTIALPTVTTPFQSWARALAAHAKSDAAVRELEFWTRQAWGRAHRLPTDLPGGENTVGSMSRTIASLTADDTSALVKKAPERFDAQLNEILLAALYLALRDWTGNSCLLVDVEGHGREAVVAGADLSRTVGWFTTIFPVMIEARPAARPDEIVERVRQQLRAVPDGGLGFGVLRYLADDADVRAQLTAVPQPDISFLYLGRMEQAAGADASMRLARRPVTGNRSPLGRRRHAIELEAILTAGRLQVTWIYSHALHRADTIDRLSSSFMAAIRELMVAAPVAMAAPTGGRMAADFPAARLDQHELDSLLSGFGRDGSGRT